MEHYMSQFGGNPGGLVPIQAEKGEYIAHLDGTITPVSATKSHKRMGDDEVTDIVQEGTFIGSRDPKMRFTKKEASSISLGQDPHYYMEGKKTTFNSKEHSLADLYRKGDRKLTPAQLLQRIKNKYPLSKNEDMYASIADQHNMEMRKRYIAGVQQANEYKKMQQGVDEYAPQMMGYGGKPKRYQTDGTVDPWLGTPLPYADWYNQQQPVDGNTFVPSVDPLNAMMFNNLYPGGANSYAPYMMSNATTGGYANTSQDPEQPSQPGNTDKLREYLENELNYRTPPLPKSNYTIPYGANLAQSVMSATGIYGQNPVYRPFIPNPTDVNLAFKKLDKESLLDTTGNYSQGSQRALAQAVQRAGGDSYDLAAALAGPMAQGTRQVSEQAQNIDTFNLGQDQGRAKFNIGVQQGVLQAEEMTRAERNKQLAENTLAQKQVAANFADIWRQNEELKNMRDIMGQQRRGQAASSLAQLEFLEQFYKGKI